MRFVSKAALAGALAAGSLVGVTSAASAVTVSPTGSYTFSSSNTVLTLTSTRQSLTCALSQISGTVDAAGNVSIPAGSVSYSTCTNTLLGRFTVAQSVAWSGVITRSGSSTILTVTVPTGGATITNGTCSFNVSGTAALTDSTTSGSILTTTPLPVTSSSLTAASVSGCSPALVVNGLAATYSGTYNSNRAVTVTP